AGIETLNPNSAAVVVAGGPGNNTLVVTATGPNSGSYSLNGGAPVNFSDVTSFTFNGGSGNNTMTVNNPPGGLFAPSGGVFFNGSGGANSNKLAVQGGAAINEVFNFVPNSPGGGHNGSFSLVGSATMAAYTYTDLSPVLVSAGTPSAVVFNLPNNG